MEQLQQFKTKLKDVLVSDLKKSLNLLREKLPNWSPKFNNVLLLLSNVTSLENQNLKGVIQAVDYQIEKNKLFEKVLLLIDNLEEKDFTTPTGQEQSTSVKKGFLLYQVPDRMTLQKKYKSIIRIAFSKELLSEDLQFNNDTAIEDIRISDVMSVELLDMDTGNPIFEITSFSEKEQFIDKDDYTEWLFYIKPLRQGKHTLLLKVAIIEIINKKERKRNIVLEEEVQIVTEDIKEEEFEKQLKAASLALLTPINSPLSPSIPTRTKAKSRSLFSSIASKAAMGLIVVLGGWYMASSSFSEVPANRDQIKKEENTDVLDTITIQKDSSQVVPLPAKDRIND